VPGIRGMVSGSNVLHSFSSQPWFSIGSILWDLPIKTIPKLIIFMGLKPSPVMGVVGWHWVNSHIIHFFGGRFGGKGFWWGLHHGSSGEPQKK